MATYAAGRWTGLRLENFRRFEDTGYVELRPVTLFLGKNSSGKTSLLRSLLLWKQLVLNQGGTDVPLVGPEADFGSYKELVHAGELRRDVRLSFSVKLGSVNPSNRESLGALNSLLDGANVEVVLHWNARAARAQLDCFAVTSEDGQAYLALNRHGPHQHSFVSSVSAKRILDRPLTLSTLRMYPLSIGGGARGKQRASRERERGVFRFTIEEYALFMIMQELFTAANALVHIGPLREMPSRAYRVDQLVSTGSTASVVEVFNRQRQAQRRVSRAIGGMGMAKDVTLVPLAPGYVGIALTDTQTGRIDNLADVGFGVSQVLPILVTLATVSDNSTVLIEQPELHLHPDAQGQLADVMVEFSKERQATLAIETHSEHIMLRLQRRIAEGALAPADVAIYVVDDGAVREVPLDPSGRLDPRGMPEGFFEEEWEDALRLAKAAARRSLA